MNDVHAMVRSLRASRWSRNRHFAAHQTPEGRAARKLHRFLRGLERDLRAAPEVAIESDPEGVTLRLRFPAVRFNRVVRLSGEELALVCEDPELAGRLRS